MLVFGPQSIADTRLQTPGPTSPLGSAGSGNALGVESGHAAARVETRHPGQTGVDHHPHAIDGQAGFSDVGGQHHFALAEWRGVDGGALGGEVQFAVQWTEQHIATLAQGLGQLLMDPADLGLPGQEHQDAAGFIPQCIQYGLHQPRLDELAGLERPAPTHRHREHAAFAAQDRRVVQQPGQALTFQGGGHQQDLQWLVFAKQLPTVETPGPGPSRRRDCVHGIHRKSATPRLPAPGRPASAG